MQTVAKMQHLPTALAFTSNKIYNTRWGMGIASSNTLFDGNEIDNFGDDGLDIAGNNLLITKNRITNNNDIGDYNHEDGIQGQIGRGTAWSNITIDSNSIIRQTNPKLDLSYIYTGNKRL